VNQGMAEVAANATTVTEQVATALIDTLKNHQSVA